MHRFPNLPHYHIIHHDFQGRSIAGSHHDFQGTSIAGCGERYLEAEAVVNHSLVDAALQVGTNIVVQNLTPFGVPKHKLARFLHNVLVTYLLTETHSGLDLPWGTHRLCPWLCGGAPRHALHHASHRHCFQQFFTYLDDALGFGPPAASKAAEE